MNIVNAAPSDCILSSNTGYAISDGAKQVTTFPDKLPFDLITNGLEIVTERKVFDTGQNFINVLSCPHCNKNIAFDDWDLDPWNKALSDNLSCTRCELETEIHNYRFEPDWGFSDLGFTFWNLPEFREDFINEFKKKLDCGVSIVRQHI
ncbi:hypothetical protein FAZ15_19960 [Sphingobacterium olei]|uniref:Uncharacterized protein n=1 Tax=Sphingobacterium olei TaxID=2571155 RepID=A0A4U0NCT2_9SPHI|nr:hypothetical protein [Sphingobacterium olei]TJZ51825.1 hypothetical protein FAZ15_19960 [Sphingobacterium olei]